MDSERTCPSYRALTRFFLPLVIISFSQTFTYPLVASVISHGPLEGLEFEAYVIGQQVVTFLSSIGHGLVTTGIVFATTQRGRAAFMRLNLYMALAAALCQLAASLPMAEDLIFRRFLAVENPALRAIARHSLLACIPVQMNFYVRNAYTAQLFRNKRSDLANVATLLRIAIAVPLSWLFVRAGLVGYLWGAVAMTLPCFAETALTWWYARPYLAALPDSAPGEGEIDGASVGRQLRFTLPLSLGSVLMTATAFITTVFYSYSSDPERFRLVHYVTYGLAAFFFASALKFQTVAVVFAKTAAAARRVAVFVVAAGVGLGAILLAVSNVTPFARWYFCVFQKIPTDSLGLASAAVTVGAFVTLLYALRGFVEGLAAIRLAPRAVLAGQLVFVIFFAGSFALCTRLLVGRDHLWGMTAIAVATTVSTLATYVAARLIAARRERP